MASPPVPDLHWDSNGRDICAPRTVRADSSALGNQSERGPCVSCRDITGIDSGICGDGFLADMCGSRAHSV